MYIGIYISDSFISAGLLSPNGQVVMVNDESSTSERKFLTPLTAYIEDNYGYLGSQVDYLVANNSNLVLAKYFLDPLGDLNATTYIDQSKTSWNAAALLAVFLKKLQLDVQICDDRPIEGAVVCLSRSITPAMTEALKWTFNCAKLPLCGILNIGKAALYGYGLNNQNLAKSRSVLLYNMDPLTISLELLDVDSDNLSKTVFMDANQDLGEHRLYHYLSNFLVRRYENITGKKLEVTKQNALKILPLAKEALSKYLSESEPSIRIVYHVDEPVIELIVTRHQIDTLMSKYMSENITLMKDRLKDADIDIQEIDEVLITGTSKILDVVKKHLIPVFKNKTIIHLSSPEEVIVRGATLHANNAIEREISSSLLSKKAPDETISNELDKEHIDIKPDQAHLISLINNMHINMMCDF